MFNIFEPIKQNVMNIQQLINWWQSKKLPQEKGGSFNLPLYLEILKIRNNERVHKHAK